MAPPIPSFFKIRVSLILVILILFFFFVGAINFVFGVRKASAKVTDHCVINQIIVTYDYGTLGTAYACVNAFTMDENTGALTWPSQSTSRTIKSANYMHCTAQPGSNVWACDAAIPIRTHLGNWGISVVLNSPNKIM